MNTLFDFVACTVAADAAAVSGNDKNVIRSKPMTLADMTQAGVTRG